MAAGTTILSLFYYVSLPRPIVYILFVRMLRKSQNRKIAEYYYYYLLEWPTASLFTIFKLYSYLCIWYTSAIDVYNLYNMYGS